MKKIIKNIFLLTMYFLLPLSIMALVVHNHIDETVIDSTLHKNNILHECNDISCLHCRAYLLSNAAMSLVDKTIVYDDNYYKMDYPMGDVPDSIGVCTDVVIRAYRKLGIDLQQLIHEDIMQNGYNLSKLPDPCIDHRRVPNIQTFMEINGTSLSTLPNPHNYLPGDIVTWKMGRYEEFNHIGIVVDKKSDRYPFVYQVMHNIGGGQVIEDCLFHWTISGHYRY